MSKAGIKNFTVYFFTVYNIVRYGCQRHFVQTFDYNRFFKVHKIEIFFGFDFEICINSLFVTSKY
jgi:hypothetical protein